jgi:hypothetical protein
MMAAGLLSRVVLRHTKDCGILAQSVHRILLGTLLLKAMAQ